MDWLPRLLVMQVPRISFERTRYVLPTVKLTHCGKLSETYMGPGSRFLPLRAIPFRCWMRHKLM